jgi:hypothetical protein
VFGDRQSEAARDGSSVRLRSGRFQLFSDFGSDVDGLYRYSFGALIESVHHVGVETRWSYWLEPFDDGSTDSLWFGDVSGLLRIVQTRAVQSHLGAGVRLMLDPEEDANTHGFQGVWGLEAYPARPLALRVNADIGNLGPAFLLESQATLGAMLSRVEVYAGYHLLLIDETAFMGPFGGVRLHL